MPRVYILQNWYALSDPMAEETLYDSAAIIADDNAHLADKGINLRSGALDDVSRRTPSVRVSLRKIIDAPSSTKNKAGTRDPEMSSTKKGNDWYFSSEEDQKLNQ